MYFGQDKYLNGFTFFIFRYSYNKGNIVSNINIIIYEWKF